uniref:Glutamyl-tRNA reductase n=1 Tax=Rhizophora mucronata TaxID=61149 RepID=A0A2P2IWU3_RHIMU
MAVSYGFAAALAGAKMETFLLNSASSSSVASSPVRPPLQLRVFCKPNRRFHRRMLEQRGGVRCEVATSNDVGVESDATTDLANVSSLSALEQLKASAADSESLFPLSMC